MESQPIVKWLNKELSALLECEIGDEYSKNILNIETESELKEFIGSLLDLNIQKNKYFLDELLRKLKKPSNVQEVKVYRKPEQEETFKSKKNKTPINKQETEGKLIDSKKVEVSLDKTSRRSCECQASKHKLIANCLKCGRIVCAEEGSGPCYFCGSLVCTREELEKIKSGSKKGENLKNELMKKNWNAFDVISDDLKNKFGNLENQTEDRNNSDLLKAIAHKDKLIDFDRTSAKRTQVIDDESDYFNTNSKWLSQQQRTLLEAKETEVRSKRFGSKLDKKFTLDFAGRKVIDEQENIDLKNYAKEIEEILKENKSQQNTVFNQTITSITPKFVDEKMPKKIVKPTETNENIKYRIQDQGIQEMKDEGCALSMHQPWASLLIHGIKKHEGRTWYTPHRGRLWIHAASKQPTEQEITETEAFYNNYYSSYVDLDDCLSAEAYRNEYTNGESNSDFVFICKNPKELFIKIPMNGQHKIFKLDKSIHMSAKKSPIINQDENVEHE